MCRRDHDVRPEDETGRRHRQHHRDLVERVGEQPEDHRHDQAHQPALRPDEERGPGQPVHEARSEQEAAERAPQRDHQPHRAVAAEAEQAADSDGQQPQQQVVHVPTLLADDTTVRPQLYAFWETWAPSALSRRSAASRGEAAG